MRALLAVATLLLAGSMIWVLARPAAQTPAPASPDGSSPKSAEPAAQHPQLKLDRVALPSPAERQLEIIASLPHTSLSVRILDSYDILSEPCAVFLEVRLPTERMARGERNVDENGECRFEMIPAGRCRLQLVRNPRGSNRRTVCEQSFTLTAGEPASHIVNLHQAIVWVDLQCANPPRGGLESVELSQLSQGSSQSVEWTCEDPASGTLPGQLQLWAPVGAEFVATFITVDDEYVESRKFEEPGLQTWLVELPTGELHLFWPPSGGLDKFVLDAAPDANGKSGSSSCFSDNGRGSFTLLPRGQYLARAGTIVRGKFHERARSMVEIGSEPVHLTLESAAAGRFQFVLPLMPDQDDSDDYWERHPTWGEASLLPAGKKWPVFASQPCGDPASRCFESVLAGDYDLEITRGNWVSTTPVTVAPGQDLLVQARDWIHYGIVHVGLFLKPGQSPPARAELIASDGVGVTMDGWQDVDLVEGEHYQFTAGQIAPGAARFVVTSVDGIRTEFDLVIVSRAKNEFVFEIPPR